MRIAFAYLVDLFAVAIKAGKTIAGRCEMLLTKIKFFVFFLRMDISWLRQIYTAEPLGYNGKRKGKVGLSSARAEHKWKSIEMVCGLLFKVESFLV